ncbi:exodeoxyribonuclease III [Olavius algarvensis spirochete endosymbiont]|uniref:exodeoxyribonuclease III n=1 Tax=Olavius algarvensis spirochete endosymbiont TaxID=260710 RepID=UPI000F51AE48|nr:exodeoxyribonuclease III [Olavius algarvensis spirochete endosymbiont]
MMKIVSWNVNGVRAACKKGLMEFITASDVDFFFIQETKAHLEQLSREVYAPAGYQSWWQSAEKRGYSGTAFWARKQPDAIELLGVKEFDSEGRVQVVFFDNLALLNCYFPNSQIEGARLEYKLGFNVAVKKRADKLVDAGKTVAIIGDYNVAHKPIDLAHPKANEKNPGYLPEERAWMDSFIAGGWTDTFRVFENGPNHYTWWSYRANARQNNVGWRIDYFCVNDASAGRVKSSRIMPDINGSDHCPIAMELN